MGGAEPSLVTALRVQPNGRAGRQQHVTTTDAPVDAGLQDDGDALAALYARLWPPLVRLANLLAGSESAAEDIVQDAFERFRRHAASVDNPDGYLRTSVVNLARTSYRRRQRERDFRPEVVTMTNLPEVDETWIALRRLPD